MASRFVELELGAAKVPAQITTEAEAKTVIDWIGEQCKRAILEAEQAHAREKKPYLDGGRVVDRFSMTKSSGSTTSSGPILRQVQQFFDTKKAEQRRREEADRRRASRRARWPRPRPGG